MEAGKGEKKMSIAIPQYNIRDTKKRYSELNNIALKGIEVITYNANNEEEKVSHIKTTHLDRLLDNLSFCPIVDLDDVLGIYTVALNEIDLYGEGNTVETAVINLIDSILQFLIIYIDKIDLFSKVESDTKQLYLLKLLRCNGDKEQIKKVIGY
ncbi:MAG: hypothetical protein VR69_09770 [Peptococcaceae bacterium BRH_c4b]|nr:MAG: hypothetical protein VR69_16840 [Peptococcaceae bacterium BRH_c4b]KJS16179.1 MAG: hypothetical protein VR69_09770 [Peptococcaceae bacterium BRH_c4b]